MCFLPSRVTLVDLPVMVAGKTYLIISLFGIETYDIFKDGSVHGGQGSASRSNLSSVSLGYIQYKISVFRYNGALIIGS